jgi:hypothetical protein
MRLRGWHFLQDVSGLEHISHWDELLYFGAEMEDVLLDLPDEFQTLVLGLFIRANSHAATAGHAVYAFTTIRLNKRLIDHLGKIRSFEAQGKAIFHHANLLAPFSNNEDAIFYYHKLAHISFNEDATFYYQKLRDLGAEMGCFTMECMACRGLGEQALLQGRQKDGFDLLRNAVVASSLLLPEDDQHGHEVTSLQALTTALFGFNEIDEAETLVLRMVLLEKGRQYDECERVQIVNILYMIRLHEARDRPKEAADELRILVNLLYRHRVELRKRYDQLRPILLDAKKYLKILHPETGDKKLIASLQRATLQCGRPE